MQIVIPMSGFGERFRRAGYTVPKPLIEVDGKPIIAHVVEMFPDEHDFLFICNQDHLANPNYRMSEILRDIAPLGRIIGIPAHSLGPVNAVLQAADHLDPDQPTIVNYCDFTCYWNYADLLKFLDETSCDGCIPAYRGFHPHTLGSTYYAYLRHADLWMTQIQEKQPFTDDPQQEFASSGTYYFRSGALCLDVLQQQVDEKLDTGGEYYVSMAYQIMAARGLSTAIYELQHFMQWGTPQDLLEYRNWSRNFRDLAASDGRRARHDGAILLPMAGMGKRFSDAGYTLPKPLIRVSGRPMVVQAVRDLPDTAVQKFVTREGIAAEDAVERKLRSTFVGSRIDKLDTVTQGQAITTQLGLAGLDPAKPVTVGACDNGILYDVDALNDALSDGLSDVLIWIVRGHADGIRNPHAFGWVLTDIDGAVTGVRVKGTPEDPSRAPMIIGAFTFMRAGDLDLMVDALVERDGRVNGEFYLDSVIDDCLNAGLRVRLFEVNGYMGWGTPNDLNTYNYWQSCFHKWPSHSYNLHRDSRVPKSAVAELDARYAWHPPARPAGFERSDSSSQATVTCARNHETAGQLARFLPIGAVTVAIDFLVYTLLLVLDSQVWLAKSVSFVAGAVFAFYANRRITFHASDTGSKVVAAFIAVYLASLVINVVINSTVLNMLSSWKDISIIIAWFIATCFSATFNFIGMKFSVFKNLQR